MKGASFSAREKSSLLISSIGLFCTLLFCFVFAIDWLIPLSNEPNTSFLLATKTLTIFAFLMCLLFSIVFILAIILTIKKNKVNTLKVEVEQLKENVDDEVENLRNSVVPILFFRLYFKEATFTGSPESRTVECLTWNDEIIQISSEQFREIQDRINADIHYVKEKKDGDIFRVLVQYKNGTTVNMIVPGIEAEKLAQPYFDGFI